MTLRIVAFNICDIDGNWTHNGQNKQFIRETWDPNVGTTIQAKQHGAGISVDFTGEVPQYFKFKNSALVTIRGNILAFDTSSLAQET